MCGALADVVGPAIGQVDIGFGVVRFLYPAVHLGAVHEAALEGEQLGAVDLPDDGVALSRYPPHPRWMTTTRQSPQKPSERHRNRGFKRWALPPRGDLRGFRARLDYGGCRIRVTTG